MAQDDYQIGSTSSTTKLTLLTTPVNPPRGDFQEWGRIFTKANAETVGHGFPVATWPFDYLSQAMVTQLRTFVGAGVKSKAIYIVTRKSDGTFQKYSCIMHWPEDQLSQRVAKGYHQNITFTFTKLEAV